jgi:predicted PurR-regulated permease PerM
MALSQGVQERTFDVAPPNEQVQQWPVVGERIYTAWTDAASNFEQFLEDYAPQLEKLVSFAAGKVAGIGLTVLAFLFSTLIAAFMLAHDAAVVRATYRLSHRLMGEHGDAFVDLSVATIRSVTVGVLGIAFIQALGTGLGMWLVGVPGTGLWALLVLILVIAQLPALLVMLPVIVWVFSQESTTVAVVFAVWSIAVSMSDAVLKPMLLGRGVDAPMLVILLGAIGGMLLYGILGLFVGAVVLALGYRMFMIWLALGEAGDEALAPREDPPPAES